MRMCEQCVPGRLVRSGNESSTAVVGAHVYVLRCNNMQDTRESVAQLSGHYSRKTP